MAKANSTKLPLVISITTIVMIILCWFMFPPFKEFLNSGFEIITSGDKQRIKTWVDGFGFWGPFIIIVAMIVQLFLIVVSTVFLMLVAILCYGPILGSLIALAGLFCASTVGYFIGKFVGKEAAEKLMGQKTSDKVRRLIDKHGYKAVILVRLTPVSSNDAISFIAGVANMNYFKFIAATFIGILPLTILLAWLGEDWERLKNGLIAISITVIAGFIIYNIYLKHVKKTSSE
ncbi:MAG: rane protein [Segetibacter sp.]|nr:rane protein [Segetibacter sp.]